MTVQDRLVKAREINGLSTYEAAILLGVTTKYVEMVMESPDSPYAEYNDSDWFRFAWIYRVDKCWLKTGEGDMYWPQITNFD